MSCACGAYFYCSSISCATLLLLAAALNTIIAIVVRMLVHHVTGCATSCAANVFIKNMYVLYVRHFCIGTYIYIFICIHALSANLKFAVVAYIMSPLH